MEGIGTTTIKDWPDASREAAQLVIDTYGEPQEACASQLIWHEAGSWKRIVASRTYYEHRFPAPHTDSVECFIDYRVPPARCGPLAEFDGSVVVERTAGEVSARCHDEQANKLALNLMHDIVRGTRSPADARRYYGREFLDYRRKRPTPYMEKLRFDPAAGGTAYPDTPVLTEQDIKEAMTDAEG